MSGTTGDWAYEKCIIQKWQIHRHKVEWWLPGDAGGVG